MNHGSTTLIFKDKKIITGLSQTIHYIVKKNDSIVKHKGEDSMFVL